MSERPPVVISLSHDAAIVVAGALGELYYGGAGPFEGRLSRLQEVAFSELLARLERCPTVSPITLGPGFLEELKAAEQRIEAANWGDEA